MKEYVNILTLMGEMNFYRDTSTRKYIYWYCCEGETQFTLSIHDSLFRFSSWTKPRSEIKYWFSHDRRDVFIDEYQCD